MAVLDELIGAVRGHVQGGDVESALREVGGFVFRFNANPQFWGQVLEAAELDALCGEIALALPAQVAGAGEAGDQNTEVYVASELYATGGHSLLIRDMIHAAPEKRHRIFLTGIHRAAKLENLGSWIEASNVEVEEAPGPGWRLKAEWLMKKLVEFAGSRVFLVTHQEDAPAIVAAMASGHGRLHFVHHADFSLTLGMHLRAVHMDVSSYSYHHCAKELGVPSVCYLPLISPQRAAREAASFHRLPSDAGFVTCSAAGGQKFELPYDFPYQDVMARVLAETRGRHVHIGSLSAEFLAGMMRKLDDAGVGRERFLHVPTVPNLAEAMADHAVDVYLTSWPTGGAKSAVDVQSSGTPVIGHVAYHHEYFGAQCMLHPEAPLWREPDELVQILKSLTCEDLRHQSAAARAHWEKYHSPEVLAEVLKGNVLESPIPAPQKPVRLHALRTALMDWGGAEALRKPLTLLATMERRVLKLEQEAESNEQEMSRARRQLAKYEQELAKIKKSTVWGGVRWLFKGENSLRKRFGRKRE